MDPIPEVRSVAARALGSLIRGMGEENFPDLVPWLLDTLKSDNSNVERSGAAQGLSEVRITCYIFHFYHYDIRRSLVQSINDNSSWLYILVSSYALL